MKIKSITPSNQSPHTYDIEIAETHNYLIKSNSGNIISHNSSLVTNSTNGIERPRSKFLNKSNKSKDFPVIIPSFKKWSYEYAFEKETNEDHIKMMAIIQKYLDMSISTNLYYNYSIYPNQKIPTKIINKDFYDCYKYGLKTIYYTNSDDGNIHNLKDEKESCAGGACVL